MINTKVNKSFVFIDFLLKKQPFLRKIHKLSKKVSPFFEKVLYFCSGDTNVNDTTKRYLTSFCQKYS